MLTAWIVNLMCADGTVYETLSAYHRSRTKAEEAAERLKETYKFRIDQGMSIMVAEVELNPIKSKKRVRR